jgi:hypothetical protein
MGNTVRSTAIKGGTPIGSASLCRTCTNAHVMSGYRDSELLTMCTEVHPNIVVPFVIHTCSNYYDKNRPSWKQMEDLALDVTPAPLKPVGFKTGTGFVTTVKLTRPATDEDDD